MDRYGHLFPSEDHKAAMDAIAADGTLFVANLRTRPGPATAPKVRITADLAEGFRYARTNSVMMGVFVVTALMNFFAFPFIAMVPVIGKEELGRRIAADPNSDRAAGASGTARVFVPLLRVALRT